MTVKVNLDDEYTPSTGNRFIISADIVGQSNREVVTASAIADLGLYSTLQVIIQPKWFQDPDLSLHSVEYRRISNADGTVPLVIAEKIPLKTSTGIVFHNRRLSETPEERTLRMTQGVPPPGDQGNLRRQLQSNKAIATHGYCSGDAWGNKLTGASKFEDYDQNRSHDQFAQLLDTYGDSVAGNAGCSIIAHSQGGAAALHLYSFYWSCLDNAPSSGRLIQTVGTPFQGTALVGNAAVLGDLFGVGCGTNYNLSCLIFHLGRKPRCITIRLRSLTSGGGMTIITLLQMLH